MKGLRRYLKRDPKLCKAVEDTVSEHTRARLRESRDTIRGGCFILQCPTLASGGKIENPNCHYRQYHDGLGCPLTRNKKETQWT